MKRTLIALLIVAIVGGILFSACVAPPPKPPPEAPATSYIPPPSTVNHYTGNQMAHLGQLRLGPALAGKIGSRDYLFVAANSGGDTTYPTFAPPGLLILDIQNPSSPQQVSYLLASNHSLNVRGMELSGTVLYVFATDYWWIIDVSNPSKPKELSKFSYISPTSIAFSGKYAYLCKNNEGQIIIMDVSDPAHPKAAGSFTMPIPKTSFEPTPSPLVPFKLKISGSILFVLDAPNRGPAQLYWPPNGLHIIDISSPLSLKYLGYIQDNHPGYPIIVPGTSGSHPPIPQPSAFWDIAVIGKYALIAAGGPDGMLVLDVSNLSAPKEVANLPGTAANHIDISGNWAYLTGFGAIMVDITDPRNPQKPVEIDTHFDYFDFTLIGDHLCFLSNQSTGPVASTIEIMEANKVLGVWQFARMAFGPGAAEEIAGRDYLFVGVNNASSLLFQTQDSTAEIGLLVLDVTNFDNPQQVAYLLAPDKTMVFQGMELSGNFLYVSAGNSFWIVDVSNPSKPREVSRVSDVRALGAAIFGARAFINDNGEKITIVDISDPVHPRVTGNLQFQGGIQVLQGYGPLLFVISTGSPNGLYIFNSSTLKELSYYSSTVLPPPDSAFSDIAVGGKYAYLTGQDMLVLDISDPANPREIGRVPGQDADHILIMGNLAFVISGGQYEMLDVSDPTNPKDYYGGGLPGYYRGSTEVNNRIYCLSDTFIQVMN